MKLTKALRAYILSKAWAAEDANDETLRGVVTAKLMAGELTAEQFKSLTDDSGAAATAVIDQKINAAVTPLTEQVKSLATSLSSLVESLRPAGGGAPAPTPANNPAPTPTPAPTEKTAEQKAFDERLKAEVAAQLKELGVKQGGGRPGRVFGGAQAGLLEPGDAKLTKAFDRYSQTKTAAVWGKDCKHPQLRGMQVTAPSTGGPGTGRPLDHPSQAEKALCGAWWKFSVMANNPHKAPAYLALTEEDWDLVNYAVNEKEFVGHLGNIDTENPSDILDGQKLDPRWRKALLDDSTSGGITLVPQAFDDALLITPLLFGELWPLVTVVNIARGRRIEQATMGRPTLSWGTPESTAIALFDTTNFFGALDTVIHPLTGAMELGRDFQEDSSIMNVGQRVIAAYGEVYQVELDKVVAVGDGITQPKGVFNTSGVTSVGSANSVGGPVALGDLEGLMFGVTKAYRTSRGANRNVFIGNETSYRRFRGMASGTGLDTRLLGENYGSYEVIGVPFKIQTDVTNSKLAFVNMAWYIVFRRLGLDFKVVDTGKELNLRNADLIVARSRMGGQLSMAGAAALMTDLAA